MATLSINEFAKTLEGKELIESGRLFCYGGTIYQGFQGVPVTVAEKQLSTTEMKACQDMDRTIERQWIIRRQRLGSRFDRKSNEYRARRAELRSEQETIESRIERRQRMGMEASKADLQDLKDLDDRMLRLAVMADDEDGKAKTLDYKPEPEPVEMTEEEEIAAVAAETSRVTTPETDELLARAKAAVSSCPECGKVQPPDNKKEPHKWLRGHMAGAHRKSLKAVLERQTA